MARFAFPLGSMVQRRLDGPVGWVYKHVGIYVGDGQVIHVFGPDKKQRGARIMMSTLEEFGRGHRVTVRAAPKCREHGEAVARKARALWGDPGNKYDGRYSAFLNNCEDFAREC